jgi:hypothetical protein
MYGPVLGCKWHFEVFRLISLDAAMYPASFWSYTPGPDGLRAFEVLITLAALLRPMLETGFLQSRSDLILPSLLFYPRILIFSKLPFYNYRLSPLSSITPGHFYLPMLHRLGLNLAARQVALATLPVGRSYD